MFTFAFIHTHLYLIILNISHGLIYSQSLNINIYSKKNSDLYLQNIAFRLIVIHTLIHAVTYSQVLRIRLCTFSPVDRKDDLHSYVLP